MTASCPQERNTSFLNDDFDYQCRIQKDICLLKDVFCTCIVQICSIYYACMCVREETFPGRRKSIHNAHKHSHPSVLPYNLHPRYKDTGNQNEYKMYEILTLFLAKALNPQIIVAIQEIVKNKKYVLQRSGLGKTFWTKCKFQLWI